MSRRLLAGYRGVEEAFDYLRRTDGDATGCFGGAQYEAQQWLMFFGIPFVQFSIAWELRVRECESARVRECESARVRECESARVRECESERVRECERAECESARVRECESARVRECKYRVSNT
jgi:hypothetical protein